MTDWFIIGGAVALVMAYASGKLERMPLSTPIVYLVVGYILGPRVLGALDIAPAYHAETVAGITEIVIVISIFGSALKIDVPPLDRRWSYALRLALGAMALSIGCVMWVGWSLLGLPAAMALLLGAILAPTDPVLASAVQVERPYEFHRLRFALTGEAGLNDGSALPVVLLGLALMGIHPMDSPLAWALIHVVWGFLGAVVIGGTLGYLAARYMLHLRVARNEEFGSETFLSLGVIGLAYGVTSIAHAIGFVAVFAAGIGVRTVETLHKGDLPETIEIKVGEPPSNQEAATDREKAPIVMLMRLRTLMQSLERIGEAIVVIMVGALLDPSMFTGETLIVMPLLFFVIRPLSALVGLAGSDLTWREKGMISWFGIRGMASVYYLAFMTESGVPDALVRRLAHIVIGVIVYSVLAHGISVTPLMSWFDRRAEEEAGE